MAISFVQDWGAPLNASDATTRTLTGAVTSVGNTLFIDISLRGATIRPTKITIVDGPGNTWTLVSSLFQSSANGFMFVCHDAQPVSSVTISWFNDADQPVSTPSILMLSEYSGVGQLAQQPVSVVNTSGNGGLPTPTPVISGQLVRGMLVTANSDRTWELTSSGVSAVARALFRGSLVTLTRADGIVTTDGNAAIGWNRLTGSASDVVMINAVFLVSATNATPEPLAMSAATGWTTVVGDGDRLNAISDGANETYVESAANPTSEILQLTLPPLSVPTQDLSAHLQLSTSSAPGNLLPELYIPGSNTWVAAPTIRVIGSITTYTAVWPLASLSDITTQQWASGVAVRLTAQVD